MRQRLRGCDLPQAPHLGVHPGSKLDRGAAPSPARRRGGGGGPPAGELGGGLRGAPRVSGTRGPRLAVLPLLWGHVQPGPDRDTGHYDLRDPSHSQAPPLQALRVQSSLQLRHGRSYSGQPERLHCHRVLPHLWRDQPLPPCPEVPHLVLHVLPGEDLCPAQPSPHLCSPSPTTAAASSATAAAAAATNAAAAPAANAAAAAGIAAGWVPASGCELLSGARRGNSPGSTAPFHEAAPDWGRPGGVLRDGGCRSSRESRRKPGALARLQRVFYEEQPQHQSDGSAAAAAAAASAARPGCVGPARCGSGPPPECRTWAPLRSSGRAAHLSTPG
eukprot:RCo011500